MSTKSNIIRPDKVTECLICGKIFPRGIVDLNRHQSAVTLKHILSYKKIESFQLQCTRCNLFFMNEQHLNSHSKFSSCNPKVLKMTQKQGIVGNFVDDPHRYLIANAEDIPLKTTKTKSSYEALRSDGLNHENEIKALKKTATSSTDNFNPDGKALECQVCGKLFPRGFNDLNRHMTAMTLRHYFNKSKSSGYKYQCTKCDYYFTSLEHLNMHKEHSSCNTNPAFVQNLNNPDTTSIPSSFPSSSSSNTPTVTGMTQQSSISNAITVPRSGNGRGRPPRKYDINDATRKSKAHIKMTVKAEPGSTNQPVRSSSSDLHSYIGLKRQREINRVVRIGDVIESRRNNLKRVRTIVPEDRKAFYAIASLLVDRDLRRSSKVTPTSEASNNETSDQPIQMDRVKPTISVTERLTINNFKNYIPKDKLAVLERLELLLSTDC